LIVQNLFSKRPSYKPLDDGVNWTLTKPLKYYDTEGRLIVVPAGFTTDFASIPDLSSIGLLVLTAAYVLSLWWWEFWFLVVPAWWVVYIAESFLHEGTWDDQAALHDFLYRTRFRTFWQSNWILFKAMIATGGDQTPFWKRAIIFGGVTVGGWWAWYDDGRKIYAKHNS
jgi:hypothetical protein